MRTTPSLRLLGLCFLALGACHHAGTGGVGDAGMSSDLSLALVIAPADPTLVVTPAAKVATQVFTATLGGQPVVPVWTTDRAELGSIANDGTYSTTGNLGGKATIEATYNGLIATTTVTVQYKDLLVNGDVACPAKDTDFGSGGYGGVGGIGPGCSASPTQVTTLAGTPMTDAAIAWLYPYDATIFPRGQLAPLLMWRPGTHSFDSLRLQMASKSGTYTFDGSFAKPTGSTAHPATGPFQNMPIPQDVWNTMNLSASGDEVTITVTLGEGATAYAVSPVTWRIADGTLRGVVYYNSYGTALVTNSGQNDDSTPPAPFGAGTLSIHAGDHNPALVAGSNSTDTTGCRVCHSVSRDGSRLVTQDGTSYSLSKLIDLKNGNAETTLSTSGAFPGVYPDGSLMLSSSGALLNGDTSTKLYALPGGTVAASTGLDPTFQADMPSFAADGSAVAFNWQGGTGADQKTIATMTFDKASSTFGAVTPLVTPTGGPGVWPSFLPSNNGVVYEVETKSGEFGFTRGGIEAHLEWVDVATKMSHTLDALNGVGYLPVGDLHADDTRYNYEPTVNPVPSGGYAWVVFTSRRMYGNVATQDPFLSDPRYYDWRNNTSTKKLWVAAIDLNAKAGTDPSHPAFYLPAQELLAGNSRGFWTVDPCAADGASCETGDECCGGYCSPATGDAATGYVCSAVKPTCAPLYDKCSTDADCCPLAASIDPSGQQQPTCINGYCSAPTPPPIF